MADPRPPRAVVVRHGETAWSASGRHTGATDVELTDEGRALARTLGATLAGGRFALVLTSPLRRARDTAALAGFPDAEVDTDLVEWDYGDYEGLTTPQIRETVPGWTVWTHAVPGGEAAEQVAARADRVIARIEGADGDVAVFSHGHFLRVLAARWVGLEPGAGRFFLLSTASLSALSYAHNLSQPAIRLWDDDRHVCD